MSTHKIRVTNQQVIENMHTTTWLPYFFIYCLHAKKEKERTIKQSGHNIIISSSTIPCFCILHKTDCLFAPPLPRTCNVVPMEVCTTQQKKTINIKFNFYSSNLFYYSIFKLRRDISLHAQKSGGEVVACMTHAFCLIEVILKWNKNDEGKTM